MLGNALLLAAWVFAFRATLPYAGTIFAADSHRTSLYLLIAAGALIAVRARRARPNLRRAPVPHARPLLLIAAALAANILLVRVFDLRMLSVAAFGAGTYGLLGLYVAPAVWQRGIAGALLLVLALPFGDYASTYLGFSARLLTAEVVEAGLRTAGIAAVSSSSVLALESGVAYIDVPCSGIKSLWTGAIFFFGATYFERVRIDLRWMLNALLFAAAILAANIARVAAIVVLATVLELPRAAKILHEPLGILGFAIACAIGVLLLKRGKKDEAANEPDRSAKTTQPWLIPALIAGALASGAFATYVEAPKATLDLTFELAFDTEPLELTEAEAGLLGRVGDSAAKKLRFDDGTLSGTAMILATERWRAHHPPEICLASAGAKIGEIRDLDLGGPTRRARLVSIDNGARTALYFYASRGETTGDIVERIFADVFGARRWVMISILIDRPVESTDPALAALYEQFRRGVKS